MKSSKLEVNKKPNDYKSLKFLNGKKLFPFLYIVVSLLLIAKISSQSQERINSHPDIDYTIQEIIDFSSLGYCSKEQLYKEMDLYRVFSLKSFRSHNWRESGGRTFSNFFNFSFYILYNYKEKKVLISVSGTKNVFQLTKEFFNQRGIPQKDNKAIKLMQYLNDLRDNTKEEFFEDFKTLLSTLSENNQDINEYKFIFTGHSLGASMASIYLYEIMKENLIPLKNNFSPELITLGQPRTGNYAFSNELNKVAGKIIRIVQEGDGVTWLPVCKTKSPKNLNNKEEELFLKEMLMTYDVNELSYLGDNTMKALIEKRQLDSFYDFCVNEYEKEELDSDFDDYLNESYKTEEFYPWHLGGLFINPYNEKSTNELINCQNTSEKLDKCNIPEKINKFKEWALAILRHTRYFGAHISKHCRDSQKE